jgi:hypothetical protein
MAHSATNHQSVSTSDKSRVFHKGEWSALNEATFFALSPQAGDANMDSAFDQWDIVAVLQANKYRTGQRAKWADGDWNGDGVFDQLDIVTALATGDYLQTEA